VPWKQSDKICPKCKNKMKSKTQEDLIIYYCVKCEHIKTYEATTKTQRKYK